MLKLVYSKASTQHFPTKTLDIAKVLLSNIMSNVCSQLSHFDATLKFTQFVKPLIADNGFNLKGVKVFRAILLSESNTDSKKKEL